MNTVEYGSPLLLLEDSSSSISDKDGFVSSVYERVEHGMLRHFAILAALSPYAPFEITNIFPLDSRGTSVPMAAWIDFVENKVHFNDIQNCYLHTKCTRSLHQNTCIFIVVHLCNVQYIFANRTNQRNESYLFDDAHKFVNGIVYTYWDLLIQNLFIHSLECMLYIKFI